MIISNTSQVKTASLQLADRFSDKRKTISICGGTGCRGSHAREVLAAFRKELDDRGMADAVSIKETGCHGFCERGPLVVIRPADIFYQQVRVEHVSNIIEKSILANDVVEELLFELPDGLRKVVCEKDVPFYQGQQRLIFGMNGFIDPTSIEDYIGRGGYCAAADALEKMKPEEIVDAVDKSGLRGRGGGGFPTGRKWLSCMQAKGNRKFAICNADEGDPGAYMDRSILEGNPHSVIEGMIIGAFAIGAHEGYVYVRTEYPLAVKNLGIALEQARQWGILGEHVFGTDFSFDVKISKGGGAYVCGESTALMLSIEGHVGEPRTKHIHTVESGLYDLPSNLNNVETWANIPHIIRHGFEWYRAIGTQGSPGTKLFSLVGKVVNTGLVEVPLGKTLRQIIFDIGGGIPNGKKFKAVQTGGPSGGCLPEACLDMPVDFDELTNAGSMMGSGGMIVMDEDTCMVDVARYFLSFLVEESCGKCTPCREGTYQLHKVVQRITQGHGTEKDLDLLEELSDTLSSTSLCALGKTAHNPVMSTIRHFRNEYEAHIHDKKCLAGVCKSLFKYRVESALCTKCGVCFKRCPSQAIVWEKKKIAEIVVDKCTKCGICFEACKFKAKVKA